MELSENEKKFIAGLEKLTRETGITFKAESYDKVDLSLYPANIDSEESGYGFVDCELMWIDPSDEMFWDKYKGSIIKDGYPI
jgi:hypothetical protein